MNAIVWLGYRLNRNRFQYMYTTCTGTEIHCDDEARLSVGNMRLVVLLVAAVSLAHAADDSCAGHCGSKAQSCWCNDECEAHHDCCHDYDAVCGGVHGGSYYFFSLGDWGGSSDSQPTTGVEKNNAAGMIKAAHGLGASKPEFVLLVGDNFCACAGLGLKPLGSAPMQDSPHVLTNGPAIAFRLGR